MTRVRQACILSFCRTTLGLQWPWDTTSMTPGVTKSIECICEYSVGCPYDSGLVMRDAAGCGKTLSHWASERSKKQYLSVQRKSLCWIGRLCVEIVRGEDLVALVYYD